MRTWFLLVLLCSHSLIQFTTGLRTLGDTIQRFDITDRNGQRRSVQRRLVNVECDETDISDEWTKFSVVEAQPNAPSKLRRVEMRCQRPYVETVGKRVGPVPLFTGDWQQTSSLTFFSQPNMSSGVEVFAIPEQSGGPRRRLLTMDQLAEETGNPLIQEISQLSPAQRKLLQIKPQLVIGSGIGLGIDLACVLPSSLSFLGSCSSNSPDAALNHIAAQLETVNAFARQTREMLYIEQQKWGEQIEINRQLQDQLTRNTDSIESLQRQTQYMWEFQMALSEHMTAGFEQARVQLQQQANVSQQILDLVLHLHGKTTDQFLELTRAVQGLGGQLNDLLVTVWQIYSDRGMLRVVTRELYENYDTPIVSDMVFNNKLWDDPSRIAYPLLNIDPRKAPRPQGFSGLNTQSNAILVASSNIQFTALDTRLSQNVAWNYEFSYLCDTEFLLNNYLPSLHLKTLFARFGPPKCAPALPTNPWKCQCMVKVVISKCELPVQGVAWPWEVASRYSMSTPTPSNQYSCPNNRILSSDNNAPGLDNVLLTSEEELRNYLNEQFCQRKGEQVLVSTNPDPKIKGKAFRLTAPTNLWDIGPSNGNSAGCMSVFDANPDSNNLANFLYQSWQNSYSAIARVVIPAKEAEIFGARPSPDDGLQTIETPWARDPFTGASARSVTQRFSQPSYLTEDVWTESVLQERSGIEIRIYDTQPNAQGEYEVIQTITDIPTGVSADREWLAIPGETLSTAVQADWAGKGLIPAEFPHIGGLDYDQEVHAVGSSENPASMHVVFDPPISQISEAQSAAGRCGSLTYIIKFLASTIGSVTSGKLTIDEWTKQFQERFQPDCAREQLMVYMRSLVRILPPGATKPEQARVECELAISSDGRWRPMPTANLLCTLLHFYRVTSERLGNGEVHHFFFPYQFRLNGWVTLPAGEIRSSISSLCPSVSVARPSGAALVTLTSPTPFPNMIRYTIHTRGCVPDSSDPSRKCSRCDVKNQDLTLPPMLGRQINVGECQGVQLEFNVYTLDSPTEPCYVPPIDVSTTTNRSQDVVTTGELNDLVQRHISSQADQIAISIGDQSVRNFDLNRHLDFIAATYTSKDNLIRRVEEAVRQNYIDAGRALVPTDQINEYRQRIDERVKNESRRIAENIINNRNSSAGVYERIEIQEALQNVSWKVFGALNLTVGRLEAQQAQLNRIMDEYNKAQRLPKQCDGIFGNIPVIGQLTCLVTDAFSGVLNWLTPSSNWLWWIIVLLVFVCCCGGLIFCLFKFGGTCKQWCTVTGAAADDMARFAGTASSLPLSPQQILQIRCALAVLDTDGIRCDEEGLRRARTRLEASGIVALSSFSRGPGAGSSVGPQPTPLGLATAAVAPAVLGGPGAAAATAALLPVTGQPSSMHWGTGGESSSYLGQDDWYRHDHAS